MPDFKKNVIKFNTVFTRIITEICEHTNIANNDVS